MVVGMYACAHPSLPSWGYSSTHVVSSVCRLYRSPRTRGEVGLPGIKGELGAGTGSGGDSTRDMQLTQEGGLGHREGLVDTPTACAGRQVCEGKGQSGRWGSLISDTQILHLLLSPHGCSSR